MLAKIIVEINPKKGIEIRLWENYQHPGKKDLCGVAKFPPTYKVVFEPQNERVLKVCNEKGEKVYWILCPKDIEFNGPIAFE